MEKLTQDGLDTLLVVFSAHLAGVTFPEISAEILHEKVARCDEAEQLVTAARQALQSAEAAAEQMRSELLASGDKALQYARIYAGDAGELYQALQQVVVKRTGEGTGGGKRRPRAKKPTTTAEPMTLLPGSL